MPPCALCAPPDAIIRHLAVCTRCALAWGLTRALALAALRRRDAHLARTARYRDGRWQHIPTSAGLAAIIRRGHAADEAA